MKRRPAVIVTGILAAVFLLAVAVRAASGTDFSLVWRTIAGGGGRSSSSDYVLGGSIGQPVSGDLASADYRLGVGYWSGITDGSPAPTATSSAAPTATSSATPTVPSSLTPTSTPAATLTPTVMGTPSPISQATATPTGTVPPAPSQRIYLPVIRKS